MRKLFFMRENLKRLKGEKRKERKRVFYGITTACGKFVCMMSILFIREEYPSYTHTHTQAYIHTCIYIYTANMFRINKANKTYVQTIWRNYIR